MKLLWVRGLSPRDGPDGRRWEPQLLLLLLGRLSDISGHGTRESEARLGLPESTYWFIHRATPAYGKAISFWAAGFDASAPPSGGICAFDTGGLAMEHIAGDPPFASMDERKAYFRDNDRNLSAWESRVISDCATRWPTFEAYINGMRPTRHDRLSTPPDNDDRAWTWEARLAKRLALDTTVVLEALHLTSDDKQSFEAWFGNRLSDLSSADALRVGRVMRHAVLTESPCNSATQALRTTL